MYRIGSSREIVEMPLRRTPKKQSNEEDIDNEKHSRAMDLLYRLQQRQEQVMSTMENSSLTQCTGDMLESELQAIDEALCRLHRVFKQAKSELNSSQHFPTFGSMADSVKRKQVQINARLTKCISLSKTQKNLIENYEKMKQRGLPAVEDSSEAGDVSCGCSSCDTDSTAFDVEADDGASESMASDSSSLFSSAAAKRRHTVPFRQPIYSQHTQRSQAQTFLDDILGCGDSPPQTSKQPVVSPARCKTMIGSVNGKMFASPPRPALVDQSALSAKVTDVTNHSLNESCASSPMDVTGIFEPSQRETLFHQPYPSKDSDNSNAEKNLPADVNVAISPQNEPLLKHPRIHADTVPQYMNTSTGETAGLNRSPRKFVMTPSMTVRLISNSQLHRLTEDVWSENPSALSKELVDEIARWD